LRREFAGESAGKEAVDDRGGLGGLLEMAGMEGVTNGLEGGIRAYAASDPLGDPREAFVALTGDEKRRGRYPAQVFPERFLHAGAAEPQRRGKPGGVVRETFFEAGGRVGQPFEQRPGEPSSEKFLEPGPLADRAGRTDLVELPGECGVGAYPLCSLGSTFDAGGRSDEYGAFNDLGSCDREMQEETSTERITEIVSRSVGVGDDIGALPEVGADGGVGSVPWKVCGYYLTVVRERRQEGPPTTRVLGEPVEKYESPGAHGR
jgi:hypothetical protein